MIGRWIFRACAFGLALLAFSAAPLALAAPNVDNVNGSATTPFLVFAPNNVGWVYVPTSSYALDGLFTTFSNIGSSSQQGPILPRTVTASVYDTNVSGALLARITFSADGAGGNLGGSFAPVLLLAGHKYFITYENVNNIGLNITNWIPSQAPGTVNLEGWYTGPGFGTYYAKTIENVLQVFSAPILRFNGTPFAAVASTDCLFNWAESHYPSLFAPLAAPSLTYLSYYYRYYRGTNSYVGVSATDNHVYYIGPDGLLRDEGPLPGWLLTSGCG